jgi:hypothetical protein
MSQDTVTAGTVFLRLSSYGGFVSLRLTSYGSQRTATNRLHTARCRTREGGFMRAYRDIATLAAAQLTCFLVLTHAEPNFFLIHLYQSILYIAILVMLFYMEDR